MISKLIDIKRGITAIIGGGGKTTLMHGLAHELCNFGTVIITTTTHIMKSDVFNNVLTKKDADNIAHIKEELLKHRCVCVGSVYDGKKLSPPDVSIDELSDICDYVLVEADGSKGLPLKAHLENEPVVPTSSTKTILVVGIDALGNKVCDVTHRYEKACELLGCKKDDVVTPDIVAELVNAERLHDLVVVNKCDSEDLCNFAQEISSKINTNSVIASLSKGEWYVSSN